jgi:hypothetical protein
MRVQVLHGSNAQSSSLWARISAEISSIVRAIELQCKLPDNRDDFGRWRCGAFAKSPHFGLFEIARCRYLDAVSNSRKVYLSAAERRESRGQSVVPATPLFAFFFAWLAFSAIIVATDLIGVPGRGVFFRLCILAAPFAVVSGLCGVVMLVRRHDRIRAAEVQRADAERGMRI